MVEIFHFKHGDVVESKFNSGKIGVISFPSVDIETYQIKWYMGPKPWNFTEGTVSAREIVKSDKPNPLKYTSSDRYPGPASKEIDRLNSVFNIISNKPKTAKEVEAHIAILEEEITRTKDVKEIEIDSVVDETLDAEPNLGEIVDVVDVKRKKVIEEIE